MFSHRFTLCVALVLSLLFSVQPADAQQSGSPNIPSTNQNNPSRYYYAVIGAVGVPGVYEYSTGFPTLADVIHAADGLTSEASGTFRIVREGKVSRQKFYSPDSEIILLSGDILILDNSLIGTKREGRSSVVSESQDLVQIVAVNLIHRPVVMSLPSKYATLERLVSLLNQSPNVIPTVKILQTKTSEYVGPGRYLAKFRLLSQSVLIFDPSVVRIDQIPKLPPTYQPKVMTASYRHMRDSSSENSLGENSKRVIQLTADASSQSKRSQLDQAEKMSWLPPPLESSFQDHAKPSYDTPSNWTSVKGDDLSRDPPADGWKNPPESPTVLVPADRLAILENEKELPDSTETNTVPVETSEKTTPPGTRANLGWIVVGCVALVGAGWFFWRKLQYRVKPQFNFQPVKTKTGEILDALIENKLSLVEESFIFPEGLELQVPAVPPVSRKSLRVDSSHQILRPHLPSVVTEPKPDLPRSVTETSQIDAVPETPPVVSGLSETVEILQQTSVVPQSKALRQSTEQKTETDQTRFPGTEQFTAYVYSTTWPEPASVFEPAAEIDSETPSRDEADSLSSKQINRTDSPQSTSLRPHTRHSGWVLDRVLVALHGVTRQ